MTQYTPTHTRPWRWLAIGFRALASLLSLWPLLLVTAFFISPVGPHLRWTYSYQQYGSYRRYVACTYLGSRGTVDYMRGDDCPLITIIDRRVIH